MREAFKIAGFSEQIAAPAPLTSPNSNSVLIAAKTSLASLDESLGDETHRYVAVKWQGLNLFALYFAQNELKRPLFNALLKLPSKYLETPTILLGDFNTGLHLIDEVGKTFKCADAFNQLMT